MILTGEVYIDWREMSSKTNKTALELGQILKRAWPNFR